jgi:formylglycine-generating enzyme required for sulfatase activity
MNIPGYRIERELGRGGMSTVYLVEQESLGRHVALKVMALAADRSFGERFLREACTVARLTHPHILAVYDVGSAGHSYYLAMEYVPGGDLKQRLRTGPLPPQDALTAVRQVAQALGYAHAQGFVHRDVKPENILFRADGTVVLTAFGIANAVGSDTWIPGMGMSNCTPHYMSPEQARGREVDGRSDLYSLGVVLFEALAGRVPFGAEDTLAIPDAHVNDPPPHLAKLQPVLDRLLAKNPEARFASAAELVQALDAALAGQPLKATAVAPGPAAKTQVLHQAPGPGGSKRGLLWGVGGTAFAALVAGGVFLSNGNPSRPLAMAGGGAPTPVRTVEQSRPIETSKPVAAPQPSPEEQKTQRVAELLRDAEADLKAQRLAKPAGENALEKYREVLWLEPGSAQAQTGLDRVAAAYVALARQAVSAQAFGKSRGYLDAAQEAAPGYAQVAALRTEVVAAEAFEQKRLEEEARRQAELAQQQRTEQEAWRQAEIAEQKRREEAPRRPATGMEFVLVKGGCFQMGDTFGGDQNDQRPVHEVCVDDFYLGKTEVTQGQWQKVMGSTVSQQRDKVNRSWSLRGEGDSYPMYYVSWDETQDYLRKLNQQSGKTYRLPTEAEWEYAARSGGKNEKYPGGDSVDAVAWYDGNSGNQTHPVGQKRPNSLGLYDMSGNVWEWCGDWYDRGYYSKSLRNNPAGPSAGSGRVFRGGGWGGGPGFVRSAFRGWDSPGDRSHFLGFRLAFTAR